MKLLIAFLCAASAFPAMIATPKERWPKKPAPMKIAWDAEESWYHNTKNFWTETVRADCEWWGKLLAHIIVILIVVIVALLVT